MWGVCEMGILGLGGFKKKWQVTFHFRIATLRFRTTCKMALGVRNGFADPLGFRIVCEMVLGVQNFSHGLRKFHRVCEMSSHGIFIFTECAKLVRKVYEISHPMRNDSLISHALRKFHKVCKLARFFLCLKSLCN